MTSVDERIKTLISQGHSAAWEQAWDQAAACYQQILELNPNHPAALMNLGLAYHELGQLDESLGCYLSLTRITPSDPIPFEKISHLYTQMNNPEAAAKHALHAGELHLQNHDVNKTIENWALAVHNLPDDLQVHTLLARLYEKTGQGQQAIREYLIIASLNQHKGNIDIALEVLEHARQVYPQSREISEGREMLQSGHMLPAPTRSATQASRSVIRPQSETKPRVPDLDEKPTDPLIEGHQKAIEQIAEVFFQSSDLDSDEKGQKKGIQAVWDGARGLFSKQADFPRILHHLRRFLDLPPDRHISEAIKELENAIEAGLTSTAANYELGYLLFLQGNATAALRAIRPATKDADFSLSGYLLQGILYDEANTTWEAAEAYLKALQMADASMYHGKQAKVIFELYDPIIDSFRSAKNTEDLSHLCRSIRQILYQGDWRDQLKKAREQLPTESESGQPYPLAELLIQAGGTKVVGSLSQIYQLSKEGHLRSAMEEAYYALQYMPTYLPLHAYMGELLLMQGQTDEALTKFLAVANSYEARGEAQKAVELYRRLVNISPMNLNPRQKLIELLQNANDIEDAIQEYLNLAEVYYNMADLSHSREAYQKALALAQKSEAKKSWIILILHLIADIDLQSLDWREALITFDKIRKLEPSDEKARFHLIELNLHLNQEKIAQVELETYIDLLKRNGKENQGKEFLKKLVTEIPDWPFLEKKYLEYRG